MYPVLNEILSGVLCQTLCQHHTGVVLKRTWFATGVHILCSFCSSTRVGVGWVIRRDTVALSDREGQGRVLNMPPNTNKLAPRPSSPLSDSLGQKKPRVAKAATAKAKAKQEPAGEQQAKAKARGRTTKKQTEARHNIRLAHHSFGFTSSIFK